MSAIQDIMSDLRKTDMEQYIYDDNKKEFEKYIWENIYKVIEGFALERNCNIIKKYGHGFRNAMNLYKCIHNTPLDVTCYSVEITIYNLATASLYREIYEIEVEKIIDEKLK